MPLVRNQSMLSEEVEGLLKLMVKVAEVPSSKLTLLTENPMTPKSDDKASTFGIVSVQPLSAKSASKTAEV